MKFGNKGHVYLVHHSPASVPIRSFGLNEDTVDPSLRTTYDFSPRYEGQNLPATYSQDTVHPPDLNPMTNKETC
jgi:hypothetical protein